MLRDVVRKCKLLKRYENHIPPTKQSHQVRTQPQTRDTALTRLGDFQLTFSLAGTTELIQANRNHHIDELD